MTCASIEIVSRPARIAPGGFVYHVINRRVSRQRLFAKNGDYAAFERVLGEAWMRCPVPVLDFCLMPTHWHMILRPIHDGDLTSFMTWLEHTHVMRWHAHYGTAGTGHLYQSRFKAIPVQDDDHFLVACRYVERNPVRPGLAARAEHWRWSSLWWRQHPGLSPPLALAEWPVPRPSDWLQIVNEPLAASELANIRECLARNRPYGSPAWQEYSARRLGLEHTLRPLGRPRKQKPSI